MDHDSIELHGIAETVPRADGVSLQRVPENVRRGLNPAARTQMRRPSTSELRFVPEGRVEVTLSAVWPDETEGENGEAGGVSESPTPSEPVTPEPTVGIHPFWGPFQARETHAVGREATTLSFRVPEFLDGLNDRTMADLSFDPRVCRVRFHPDSDGVVVHEISGERRPPRPHELPDTRYLAYGTSITDGGSASGPHLTYPHQAARRLGWDAINLGSSGSAHCEAGIADHIAGRADWDVATLGLSVNMFDGFSVEAFEERVSYMLDTVGATGRPVLALTVFPFHPDVLADPDPDDPPKLAGFREAVHEAAAAAPATVRALSGPDLLDPAGLSVDLIHPGDHGMGRIGERLAAELDGMYSGSNPE